LDSGGLATTQADLVLQSLVHKVTNAVVPVMKKHGILIETWHARHLAVRGGTLFYADTAGEVLNMAASHSYRPGDVHVVQLKGCKAEECPAESDGAHWAFTLVTPEVVLHMNRQAFGSLLYCRDISYFYPPANMR
jgi:hypothetical protein